MKFHSVTAFLAASLAVSAQTVTLTPLGSWPGYTRGSVGAVAVEGSRLYTLSSVSNGTTGPARSAVQVWELEDFTNPVFLHERTGSNTISGELSAVQEGWHTSTLITFGDRFETVDFTRLSAPVQLINSGGYDVGSRAADLFLGRDVIAVGATDSPPPAGRVLTKLGRNATATSTNIGQTVTSIVADGDRWYLTQSPTVSNVTTHSLIIDKRGNGTGTVTVPLPAQATDMVVVNNIAYIALLNTGISWYDVSDAGAGTLLGQITGGAPSDVRRLMHWGSHLIAQTQRTLQFYRIEGTTGLPLVAERAEPEGSSLSGTPALFDNRIIVAAGGHAKAAAFATAGAAASGFLDTTGVVHDVQLAGNFAYIADGSQGFKILDITSPSAIVQKGAITGLGDVRCVDALGTLAFAGNAAGTIRMFDVKNPAAPVFLDSEALTGSPVIHDVEVRSGMVYMAAGASGLALMEINASGNAFTASAPKIIPIPSGEATDVTLCGFYAYVACGTAGLRIYDRRQLTMTATTVNPVGTLNTPGTAASVSIAPPYAYVADGTSGWHMVDISNPAVPVIRFTAPAGTGGTVNHVMRQGNRVTGAVNGRGLVTWTIDPSGATEAGVVSLTGEETRLDLNGESAAVANGTGGLRLVRLNTLTAATLADTETTGGTVRGLFRRTTSSAEPLFAAADTDGLRIYTASSGVLTSAGTYDHPTGTCMDVVPMPDFTASRRVALAQNAGGVVVVDVTTPASPVVVQTMTTNANGARRLSFSADGTKLFVARGTNGVSAYNVTTGATPLSAAGTVDFGGFCYDVSAASATACLAAAGADGLTAISAAAGSLSLGTTLPIPATNPVTGGDEIVDLDQRSGRLYGIASLSSRVFQYDITNAAAPVIVRSARVISTGLDCLEATSGATGNDRIFLGAGDFVQALEWPLDVTIPTSVFTQFNTGARTFGLDLVTLAAGGTGFIQSWQNASAGPSFQSTPVVEQSFTHHVALFGSQAILSDGSRRVTMLNIANPSVPVAVADVDLARDINDIGRIGSRLITAGRGDSANTGHVRLLNVGPGIAIVAGAFTLPAESAGFQDFVIDVEGNTPAVVYRSSTAGLSTLPGFGSVESINGPEFYEDAALSGPLLFAARSFDGIDVFSTMISPGLHLLGHVETRNTGFSEAGIIEPFGTWCYYTGGSPSADGDIGIIDASNPSTPRFAGGFTPGFPPNGVPTFDSVVCMKQYGGYLFLGNEVAVFDDTDNRSLAVLDLAVPDQPKLVRILDNRVSIYDIEIEGDLIAVTNGSAGVSFFRLDAAPRILSMNMFLGQAGLRWFSLPGDATVLQRSETLLNWTTFQSSAAFTESEDPGVFHAFEGPAGLPSRRFYRLAR